jgi:hypothetical protein
VNLITIGSKSVAFSKTSEKFQYIVALFLPKGPRVG